VRVLQVEDLLVAVFENALSIYVFRRVTLDTLDIAQSHTSISVLVKYAQRLLAIHVPILDVDVSCQARIIHVLDVHVSMRGFFWRNVRGRWAVVARAHRPRTEVNLL